MATKSNDRKALPVHDGVKQASAVRPLIFHEMVSKLAELHAEKTKDLKLSDIGVNGHVRDGVRIFELPDSSHEIAVAANREGAARKAPPAFKSPTSLTKKAKTVDTLIPGGDLAYSVGLPKPRSSTQKEIRTSSKVKNVEMNKILVSVNVDGSTGPLRFVVDVKDLMKRVAELALQAYAREGRFPRLGLNYKLFYIYCANSNFEALDPNQPVGSFGTRNFLLYNRRNNDIGDPDTVPNYAGSVQRRFMWSMMSTIVCSH